MSSETKQRILSTAIELFNAFGTGAISTNHIAKEAGMSVGNLYYHFDNKEQMIREILEWMISEWGRLWTVPVSSSQWKPSLQDLQALLKLSFQLQWKYRFFYRELLVLMRHDEQLKQRHQQIQKHRIEEQKALMQLFIEHNVLRAPDRPDEFEDVVTMGWVISNYWISHIDASGDEVTEHKLGEGIRLIMTLLQPYIVEQEEQK